VNTVLLWLNGLADREWSLGTLRLLPYPALPDQSASLFIRESCSQKFWEQEPLPLKQVDRPTAADHTFQTAIPDHKALTGCVVGWLNKSEKASVAACMAGARANLRANGRAPARDITKVRKRRRVKEFRGEGIE
jgi:hypothetical protein